MQILFNNPITDGLKQTLGINIENIVLVDEQKIVLNNENDSKELLYAGLSENTKTALGAFITALSDDIIDEYENGGVTERANAI